MLTPPYLKPGDEVAITATGRKVSPEDITPALEQLQSWGLKIIEPPQLYARDGYLAGTDERRSQALQFCIDTESIKAVFFARGGYGTTRIIDSIDFIKCEKSPKWFIGFSDITALHLKLQNSGFESIHGAMPVLFPSTDTQSIENLKSILFGEPLEDLYFSSDNHNRPGIGSGALVGGNLSMLADSLGTPTALQSDGKILFIEEIDEYLYKLDKMFVQLKRADKLRQLKGLIIGSMTNIKDTVIPFGQEYKEIVRWHTRDYDFPIAFGLSSGHDHTNFPLIMGRQVLLEVMPQKALLSFENIPSNNKSRY